MSTLVHSFLLTVLVVVEPQIGLKDRTAEANGRATPATSGSPIPFVANTARFATPTSNAAFRQESPDEVMEISSDSSDEGQITDNEPETYPGQQMRPDSEMDDEEYEPQLETDMITHELSDRAASVNVEEVRPTEIDASNAMETDQGNVSHTAEMALVDRSSVEEGEISCNMSPDDAGDSDDYEPPEPVPIVDNTAASEASEVFSPQPPSSPEEEGQLPADSSATVPQPPVVVDLTGDMGADSCDAPLQDVRCTSRCCSLANATPASEDGN